MSEIFASQEFGVMLTFLAYMIGVFIYQKTKLPIFSPLLVATILLIAYIKIAGIDLATFVTDLSGIHVFLGPLIVSLAVPIMSKMDIIKKNFVVIIVGSFVGALSSMLAVIYIGPLLGIDPTLIS
ncbi:MAG: LrgB family protein, partial [Candidatus Izemoplasmatales bacterium]